LQEGDPASISHAAANSIAEPDTYSPASASTADAMPVGHLLLGLPHMRDLRRHLRVRLRGWVLLQEGEPAASSAHSFTFAIAEPAADSDAIAEPQAGVPHRNGLRRSRLVRGRRHLRVLVLAGLLLPASVEHPAATSAGAPASEPDQEAATVLAKIGGYFRAIQPL
jgi:hypothetical protein